MPRPSAALWNEVIAPCKLSFMVSAISADAPSQFAMESDNLLKSSSDAFTIASSPDIASCPPIEAAICAFCCSVRPANAPLISTIISFRDFMDPSLLVIDNPRADIAEDTSSVGLAILVKIERRAVPACVALIPELAIRPIAVAQSSAENPREPATGATYLNVSPIIETLVFALDEAFANISAKCVESFADNPNAVSASVTMSLVVARSSPEAAARFIIPSIPPSISPVFQPAIAMY